MHSNVFYLKEKDEKIRDLTEDEVFEMLDAERGVDYVRLVDEPDEMNKAINMFLEMAKVSLSKTHKRMTDKGMVLTLPYESLIDSLYENLDDLGGFWCINASGYEIVTFKDYIRILLQTNPGEDVELLVHRVYDFHY